MNIRAFYAGGEIYNGPYFGMDRSRVKAVEVMGHRFTVPFGNVLVCRERYERKAGGQKRLLCTLVALHPADSVAFFNAWLIYPDGRVKRFSEYDPTDPERRAPKLELAELL